jgi:hypothetical protein
LTSITEKSAQLESPRNAIISQKRNLSDTEFTEPVVQGPQWSKQEPPKKRRSRRRKEEREDEGTAEEIPDLDVRPAVVEEQRNRIGEAKMKGNRADGKNECVADTDPKKRIGKEVLILLETHVLKGAYLRRILLEASLNDPE